MPFYPKKKSTYKPRRKAGRGLRLPRAPRRSRGVTQLFSETTGLGDISVPVGATGQGFNWVFKMADLPQLSQYQNLYQQFQLRKVELILIPRITSTDGSVAVSSTNTLYNGRIAYAVQDSPEYTVPTNEVNVLMMNGCRITGTNHVTKIWCKPKPVLAQTDTLNSGNLVATSTRVNPFINFDGHGSDVLHAGISAYITINGALSGSSSIVVYDMYAKYQFVCRDPR